MYTLGRCLLVLAVIVLSPAANAAMVYMKANLANEAGVVGNGEGSAFVSYDTTTHTASWGINYRNLTSQYLFSHFHGPAVPPATADVQVNIDLAGAPSPLIGTAAFTPQQEADLLAGLYYINVHTLKYPGGEIRGQVVRIDTNNFEAFTSAAGGQVASNFLNGDITILLEPPMMLAYEVFWGEAKPDPALPIAGFHCPARPGQTAPMVLGSTQLTTNILFGPTIITAAQAAEFFNGYCYFEIHKAAPIARAQVLPSHPHLANISTRARVLTGNDVVIAGFVIGGSENKTVAITAQGPSLAAGGVASPLANPKITVVRSSDQAVIAGNDDFRVQDDAGRALDIANLTPGSDLDAALVLNLPPGAYTAIVQGSDGGTGVGLVAVFEVDHHEVPLTNISTRAQVLTGDDVAIGGFVIQGKLPKTVVVTGTGPALIGAGIPNALADPVLTLVRSSDGATMATNDDWQTAANAADIVASGFAPANAKESAIMMTLQPGAYTAILSGANGGTGVGIIAVYSVQ